MSKRPKRSSVVKQGGIAPEPSDAEDVTRDTHGYSQPALSQDKDRRLAEANRAAAAAGIAGVAVPEPEATSEAEGTRTQAQDEQSRSIDETGDRVASRKDVEKLRPKRS